MKIIITIILLILSGCASDNNFKQTISLVVSNTSTNDLLNKPSYKRFDKKKLNQVKLVQIETYIPYLGKNKKKNILLAKEYLNDETSHRYFDKNSRYSRKQPHLKIETFIPFPVKNKKPSLAKEYLDEPSYKGVNNSRYSKNMYREIETHISFPKGWYRKETIFFTDTYEEYFEESYNVHSNDEPTYNDTQTQEQSYQPSSNKHLKPQSYTTPSPIEPLNQPSFVPISSKHLKPQPTFSAPSKHLKPQPHIPVRSKHSKHSK